MLDYLPHTTSSLLDLFTADLLQRAIVHQTEIQDETVDDWEPRHIHAAEQLCLYAERTYPRQLKKHVQALRNKLNITEDYTSA